MPAEPASSPLSTPIRAADLEALERGVALARAHLAALTERRRRDAGLTDTWQGGHRVRFDEALAEVERLARRLDDTLARLALASRRALDAVGR